MPAAARSYGNSSTVGVKVFCPESVTRASPLNSAAGFSQCKPLASPEVEILRRARGMGARNIAPDRPTGVNPGSRSSRYDSDVRVGRFVRFPMDSPIEEDSRGVVRSTRLAAGHPSSVGARR